MKALVLGALLSCGAVCAAQEIQMGDAPRASTHAQHVELLTDAVTVSAGKADEVELRFRVGNGLHINSHTPHDETLIPTVLKVETAGVKVLGEEYPAGKPFHLDIGAGETLDTYQGEFRVRVKLVAERSGELSGALRYQACDNASCFPPRVLPVRVLLNVK